MGIAIQGAERSIPTRQAWQYQNEIRRGLADQNDLPYIELVRVWGVWGKDGVRCYSGCMEFCQMRYIFFEAINYEHENSLFGVDY